MENRKKKTSKTQLQAKDDGDKDTGRQEQQQETAAPDAPS